MVYRVYAGVDVSIHAPVKVRLYTLEGENLEFKFQFTHL